MLNVMRYVKNFKTIEFLSSKVYKKFL